MPSALTADKETTLKAGDRFQECMSCTEMVVIQAGEFTMGSAERDDEKPPHKVVIATPFAVGRFEVTFDEWDGCVAHGGCPAEGLAGANFGRGRQPVINVSWDDAQTYVKWLSTQTGKPYRLLTEAEWEYAARAGNPGHWSFGDDESQLGEYAWFTDNSDSRTHIVGSKTASTFGLSDMHGNVCEWVEDCYVDSYADAPADGSAVPDKANCRRVLRGGSWNFIPESLRAASRLWFLPDLRNVILGFRVGRSLVR